MAPPKMADPYYAAGQTMLCCFCKRNHISSEKFYVQGGSCTDCKIIFTCQACGQEKPAEVNIQEKQLLCEECEEKKSEKGLRSSWLWIVIIAISGIFLSVAVFYFKVLEVKPAIDLKHEMAKLQSQYPQQSDHTWDVVQMVLGRRSPAVSSIVLLYQDNPETSNCLAKQVASTFSRVHNLQNDSTYFNFEDTNDQGELVEEYRDKVRMTGALITEQLDQVPKLFAQAFHFLCDQHSPAVDPALCIFTLPYKQRDIKPEPTQQASSILREAWSLPSNKLEPLLARIVTNVLLILPEKTLPCI